MCVPPRPRTGLGPEWALIMSVGWIRSSRSLVGRAVWLETGSSSQPRCHVLKGPWPLRMPAGHWTPEHSVVFANRTFRGGEAWGPRREPHNSTGWRGVGTGTGTRLELQKGALAGMLTWDRDRESRKQSEGGM